MSTLHHHQIAIRSYMIWEQSGRPDGQDLNHWLQAEQELTALFNPPARNPLADEAPAKKRAPAKKAAAPKKMAAAKKAAPKADEAKVAKGAKSRAKTSKA